MPFQPSCNILLIYGPNDLYPMDLIALFKSLLPLAIDGALNRIISLYSQYTSSSSNPFPDLLFFDYPDRRLAHLFAHAAKDWY